MIPSRRESPSLSGPLVREVWAPSRGRAVSRASAPARALADPTQDAPAATLASIDAVVVTNRRRVGRCGHSPAGVKPPTILISLLDMGCSDH
jgi:hypothetical protein